MNSLQQFVKTLSPTVLNGRHFDGTVGDVVFVQNGYGKPSEVDLALTAKIKSACELVDIRLLDHLIVSAKDYHSMQENFEM